LNSLNLKNLTEQLLSSFIEAGKIARKISDEGVKITIKSDKSPVTNGDIEVNRILVERIKNLTPDIPIISEETVNLEKKNKNKNFWLIDPIDGTRDYIKKRDEYTLNAALIINLKPEIGIIYAPKKERLFFSYGTGLAFELSNGKKSQLKCKKVNSKEIIGLENSSQTPDEISKIYQKYKVTKKIKMSSSLKFCILAAGEADIYAASPRAYEWDIAAGHAILQHAGGTLTTDDEKELLYGKVGYKNPSILAKRSKDLSN
tara:strand:+ start:2493 stop:3269 length:777 start_codon:yes stop_codon:yes gene_type:complete